MILAEFGVLYLVLPIVIASFNGMMISDFLTDSLCVILFAGAIRYLLLRWVNCSTAAFLAFLFHIVLKVINDWVFLAGTPVLNTPLGLRIRWGVGIFGYLLFLMNRKWDYDEKRTEAD